MIHYEIVPGNSIEVDIAAKAVVRKTKPSSSCSTCLDSIVDWLIKTVPQMGAGWCPPGMLGIGIGAPPKGHGAGQRSADGRNRHPRTDCRGPQNRVEELRIELYEKVNALGIGPKAWAAWPPCWT